MKSILFLHSTLEIGGAEMMRLILLRNIDQKKYNIKICCIGKKGAVGKQMEKLGFKVDELNEDSNSLHISVTYRLIKYLKTEKPDILHSSLFHSNFHGRIAGIFCRVPHLITEEHGEHRFYRGIKFFPYIVSDFILARLNDFIVCCSEKIKEDIVKKEKLPPHKTVSIQNCLDTAIYRIKEQREAVRARYGIDDELVFITVASLKIGKGHDDLIEALKDIKEMGYRFKYFFAGDGPLKPMLYNKCYNSKLLNHVLFLGNVENIIDYLNASDIFILPSVTEGLSVALLEAMLAGLASIVTDVGSNAELVCNGFNGIVIPPENKNKLKRAIIFYFKNRNLVKEFGETSKNIIKNRYSSVNNYVEEYYALWNKCGNNDK